MNNYSIIRQVYFLTVTILVIVVYLNGGENKNMCANGNLILRIFVNRFSYLFMEENKILMAIVLGWNDYSRLDYHIFVILRF